jgi:hypothetical protein
MCTTYLKIYASRLKNVGMDFIRLSQEIAIISLHINWLNFAEVTKLFTVRHKQNILPTFFREKEKVVVRRYRRALCVSTVSTPENMMEFHVILHEHYAFGGKHNAITAHLLITEPH